MLLKIHAELFPFVGQHVLYSVLTSWKLNDKIKNTLE